MSLSAVVKPATRPDRRFWILLLILMLFAAALRLYKLDVYPQVFNQDQAVLGYDAWSIWLTGRDHHGELLPVYFRAFNDYVPPVAMYITAPFVGLLGLSEFSTRLPFALMGIATVFLTALLGRRWFGPAAGLLAGLLLSIDPWHLSYSRIAFPASTMPFFTIAALYTFTRATDRLKTRDESKGVIGWFGLSALAFALLTGCYPAMKVQAPLLMGACALAAAPLLWRHWRLTLGWLALYLALISPLVVMQLLHWDLIQFRFTGMALVGKPGWIAQFFRQYADHYNWGALFFSGYKGGSAVRPENIGELFWLEGPLWIGAVIGLAQRQYRRLAYALPLLVAIWFFTFPISSSLTTDDPPHEVRTYCFVPLPELLAGYGAVVAWRQLSCYRWRRLTAAHVVATGGTAVFALFAAIYLPYFFPRPLQETDQSGYFEPYTVGLRPVLEKVTEAAQPCDVIWLESTNQTYIYYLFMTRFPPARFQQANVVWADVNGWLQVPAFEQVHFGVPFIDKHIIHQPPTCQGKPYTVYFMTHTKYTGPDWQPFFATTNGVGAPIWRAVTQPGAPQ